MGTKKYDEEFKLKIVGLYQSGHRQSDLMREFNLSKQTIRLWRKRYLHKVNLTIDGEISETEKDMITLRERIKQLEKENAIYKDVINLVKKKKK
jgi:transposase